MDDENEEDVLNINLFGIGQKAAENEKFEDVNMDEEGVTGINLFGIGGNKPSKENDAATDKNLNQPQQSGKGSNPNDNVSATPDDVQVATPVTAASGDSRTNGPLPAPPKPKPDEKVDTSKLDAELAKMKSSGPPNAQAPSPSAAKAGVPNAPQPEQHMIAPSNENTDDASAADASDENTDEDTDDASAADASDENTDEDAAIGNAEGNAQKSDMAATVQQKVNADAKNTAQTTQTPDAKANKTEKLDGKADTAGKSGQPDPKFAEKVTHDVHADEKAPQTAPISTEPVQPMTAQSVDYQKPEASELKKHPTLEKKTDVYSSIPIEKMPVTLTFETGRQKITLGELEKVKAGYTFECGNPINAPVTICANDTPIGTGELLDVDGRIGVRIIEFYNK